MKLTAVRLLAGAFSLVLLAPAIGLGGSISSNSGTMTSFAGGEQKSPRKKVSTVDTNRRPARVRSS
jgi:hypothetical protein